MASDLIEEVERVAQSDAGRNIDALAAAAAGGLASAGRALLPADEMKAVILTGAFIPFANPSAAETDGPAGAAMLAGGLRAIGADVRLISDAVCASAVGSVGDAVGMPVEIAESPEDVEAMHQRLGREGITHVISVERLGPSADGEVYNMHGEAITEHTAPLHRLLDGAWTTIAIGDGGNEIGMGVLPHSLVASHVEHGQVIHCSVPSDHLIVSGVSNWGAVALLLSVGLLDPPLLRVLAPWASPDEHARLVRVSVAQGGAVDGTTGRRTPLVDGLALERHTDVIRTMVTTAAQAAAVSGA